MKKLILLIITVLFCFSTVGITVASADDTYPGIVSPFEYVTVAVEYASDNTILLFDTSDGGIFYVTGGRDSLDRHFVNLPYSVFDHVFNVVVYQDVFQSGVDPDGYNVPYIQSVYSFAPMSDIFNSTGLDVPHSDTSFVLSQSVARDGRWFLVRVGNTLRGTTVGSILGDLRDLESEVSRLEGELTDVTVEKDRLQAILDSYDKPAEMVSFLGTVFGEIGGFLQIEVFPNITIGTIVAIPLIFGAIFLVLHFVRGS